jgi:hypothetical protein
VNARGLTESVVEDATPAWLESLGYAIKHGPETAPGQLLATQKPVVAKNVTVQILGNMQKMHIALRSPRGQLFNFQTPGQGAESRHTPKKAR